MVSLADAVVSEASDKWSTQDSAVESFAAKIVVYKRLEMLKNIDFSQVDIITIAYGTNGIGLPLENANDPLDTYTYAGATRYAIKTLLAKYPHLRIMLMTPIYRWYSATSDDGDTHQVGGQTLLDRVTKLLEVGAEIKIPTIDLYHTLGINKYNYTGYFGDDDETADWTHINSFGREQMGLRIAGELNRLF
jgi:lysophospholipase L1-like esterase